MRLMPDGSPSRKTLLEGICPEVVEMLKAAGVDARSISGSGSDDGVLLRWLGPDEAAEAQTAG